MTRPVTPITTERGDAEGFVLVPREAVKEAAAQLVIHAPGSSTWSRGRLREALAASPPASVTGTEGEKPDAERDDLTSAIATAVMGLPFSNIITQGGDLRLNPEDVEEVLTDRYGDVQKAVAAVLAKRSHPGEADRVGLERVPAQYREKVAAVLAFTEEDWLVLKHCYPEDIERFRAALGTGKGSGGASSVTARDDIKCQCVGSFGPNAECGACGGSGCVGEVETVLPHPQAPNTLSEVEEARAVLEKLSDAAPPGPWAIANDVITETPTRIGSGIATGCGHPDRWPETRAFIVALVNDFRKRQKEDRL